MNLTIFDVQHGACALLTCDNGKRIMVDCGHNGESQWQPGNYLAERGITHLDLLVITNYDEDHVSGLKNLRQKVSIGTLQRNTSVSPDDLTRLKSVDGMGDGIEELVKMARSYTATPQPQEKVIFDRVTQTMFRNAYPDFEDENNLSLVLNLQIGALNVLFPGDLEKAGWKSLLERNTAFQEIVKKTDVLIASHHGRENGKFEPLFDKYGCQPQLVVISDKGYMYDSQETVDYYRSKAKGVTLSGKNRHVLTTRKDGCIRFDFGVSSPTEITLNFDMTTETT